MFGYTEEYTKRNAAGLSRKILEGFPEAFGENPVGGGFAENIRELAAVLMALRAAELHKIEVVDEYVELYLDLSRDPSLVETEEV